MPLPSRRKGEERSKFVSRCISFMSKKGEGNSQAQRIAICNSRAAISLTDEEMKVLAELWTASNIGERPEITNLAPPLKKKKKDKFRITKEDGSGTDDTVAALKKKKKGKSLKEIKDSPY